MDLSISRIVRYNWSIAHDKLPMHCSQSNDGITNCWMSVRCLENLLLPELGIEEGRCLVSCLRAEEVETLALLYGFQQQLWDRPAGRITALAVYNHPPAIIGAECMCVAVAFSPG